MERNGMEWNEMSESESERVCGGGIKCYNGVSGGGVMRASCVMRQSVIIVTKMRAGILPSRRV